MGRCAQASKVPENHHRPCPGILIPKFEQNLGHSLKFTFLPVSLKWLPHLPSYILFLQNVPPTLPNIILFTFPPRSEASVFDPKQLGFPRWRQNPVTFLLPWTKETCFGLHPPSSRYCGRHGMHSSVCLPFHENSPGPGQGQIFKQGAEVQFLVTAHTVYLHL